jgi:predicted O-methyltransferase YrrM
MLNRIQFAVNYLFYFFTAGNKHSVHSPFVYDLVTKVINARRIKPEYHTYELIRSNMLKSNADVEILPIGASSFSGKKKLSNLVKKSAKSAKYAELLERLCAYFNPEFAIEIGSSVGISTMYQAAGIKQGFLFALEGNHDSLKIAQHNIEKAELPNVQFREGLFEQTLPQLLNELPRVDYVFFDGNHQYQPTLDYFQAALGVIADADILIFDDIHWSKDMEKAWSEIRNNEKVSCTIDLFFIGIVFFRKEFKEKLDFAIRF